MHSVIKRISLLVVVALVAAMVLAATAGTGFAKCPQSANCVVTGPGESETKSGADKNPNVKEEFRPGSRGGR